MRFTLRRAPLVLTVPRCCDCLTAPRSRDDINILVVLKAMGCEGDQEAIALIGPEEQFAALMVSTVQEAKTLGVYTQMQALDYLGEGLGGGRGEGRGRGREGLIRGDLAG